MASAVARLTAFSPPTTYRNRDRKPPSTSASRTRSASHEKVDAVMAELKELGYTYA